MDMPHFSAARSRHFQSHSAGPKSVGVHAGCGGGAGSPSLTSLREANDAAAFPAQRPLHQW